MTVDANLKNAPGAERLLWADAAKGLSILLVVLWHVTGKHLPIASETIGSRPGFLLWEQVSLILEPARMPLFFILAGMFASRSLARPLSATIRKPLNSYYVFVVWLAVSIPIGSALGSLSVNPVDTWFEVFAGLGLGATGPWFLYALALYYVAAYSFRNLSLWIVLPAAASASILSFSGLFDGMGNFHYVVANAFFYCVGIYAPQAVKMLARRAKLWNSAPLFILALILGAYLTSDNVVLFPVVRLLAGIVGCFALIMFVAALSRETSYVTKVMAWIGKRTLGIYVLHLHVLVLWQIFVLSLEITANSRLLDWVSYVYVPATVLVVAATSVAIRYLLERCGLGALFHLPTFHHIVSSRKREGVGRHSKRS